jgi:AcrR family transcriptional regulator
MDRQGQLKKRILDKASQFFFEMGYSRVTTAEIAGELGISKKTLYNFFPSKMLLLHSVIRRELKSIARQMESVQSDRDTDFLEKITKIWSIASRQIVKMSRVFRKDVYRSAPEIWEEINDFRRRFFLKRLGSLISDGVKEGIVRGDIDFRLIILLHQLVMENIINPEQLIRLSINPLEMFESMIKILYGGILTESVRKRFVQLENDSEG